MDKSNNYHISRSNKVVKCDATKKPCPLKGTKHYDNPQEAKIETERRFRALGVNGDINNMVRSSEIAYDWAAAEEIPESKRISYVLGFTEAIKTYVYNKPTPGVEPHPASPENPFYHSGFQKANRLLHTSPDRFPTFSTPLVSNQLPASLDSSVFAEKKVSLPTTATKYLIKENSLEKTTAPVEGLVVKTLPAKLKETPGSNKRVYVLPRIIVADQYGDKYLVEVTSNLVKENGLPLVQVPPPFISSK